MKPKTPERSEKKPVVKTYVEETCFYDTGDMSWSAGFKIGNQSFKLYPCETKEEAFWFENMLKKAFLKLTSTLP